MENQKHTEKEKTSTGASLEKQQKKLKNRKKLKYGGLATAITVIFVAVVVLVNVVVTQIGKRYPDFKLDLTTANLYEISDETLNYIRDMDKDVDIAISSDEATFTSDKNNKMIAETLSKYQGYSDRISVTYFDTTKDPDVLSKYQELYGNSIQSGQVIINSGSRIKVYNTTTDMFEVDQQKYQYYQYGMASFADCITAFKGEQTITSGIMNVTDSNPKAVGILATSNGNPIFAQTSATSDPNTYAFYALENLLDENGYDVSRLDLMTDELDTATYDILVLPAPKTDLSMDAIKKLQNFMYNDGNLGKQLVYIADYTQSSTPNLDAFLKEWNVQVDYSSVIDENNSTNQEVNILLSQNSNSSFVAPVVTVTDDEDYNGNLANTSLPIVAPMARSIQTLTANNGRTVTSLLTSSDTSYCYPLSPKSYSTDADAAAAGDAEAPTEAATEASTEASSTTTSFDKDAAPKGANTVMALCRDQQSTGDSFIESDVIVLGSMSMLDVNLVQNSSYNNAEYFVGLLNSVCGKEDSIVVASKDLSQTSISATATQLKAIRLTVVFLIPLVVVAAGIIVAVRRRYR